MKYLISILLIFGITFAQQCFPGGSLISESSSCLCSYGWTGLNAYYDNSYGPNRIVADSCDTPCFYNQDYLNAECGSASKTECFPGGFNIGTNRCQCYWGWTGLNAVYIPGTRNLIEADNCEIPCHYTHDYRNEECEDVDLCLTNNGGCSEFSTCTDNGFNSRLCTCLPGYEGNGIECNPIRVTVSGTVVNAINNAPISGATVTLTLGSNVVTTTTSSSGAYTIIGIAGTGTYQLSGSASGFATSTVNLNLNAGQSVSQVIALSPSSSGGIRVVLTWGAQPRDIDSHLFAPNGQHCFFANRIITGANLDRDDTDGNGPETTTINIGAQQPGTWVFRAFDWAPRTGFQVQGATPTVNVFFGNTQVASYTLPSGSGSWWDVFNLVVDQNYNPSIVAVQQRVNSNDSNRGL